MPQPSPQPAPLSHSSASKQNGHWALAALAIVLSMTVLALSWMPWAELTSIANIPFLASVPKLFNMPELYIWDLTNLHQMLEKVAGNPLIPFELPQWVHSVEYFAWVWVFALGTAVVGAIVTLASAGRRLMILGTASLLMGLDASIFVWLVTTYAGAYGFTASASLIACAVIGIGTFAMCAALTMRQKHSSREV